MRQSIQEGLLPLVARLMIVAEFVIALLGKITDWSGQAAYMAAHGLPFVNPLLGAALVIELLGSLSLILGVRAREAAALLFVYLGLVSILLHDFWRMSGDRAPANQTEFFKNLAMMGGLLMVYLYGPGTWTLSSARSEASDRARVGTERGRALL